MGIYFVMTVCAFYVGAEVAKETAPPQWHLLWGPLITLFRPYSWGFGVVGIMWSVGAAIFSFVFIYPKIGIPIGVFLWIVIGMVLFGIYVV